MSAALKQKPLTPTPFQSPQRAELAAAIVAATAADVRMAALEKACGKADEELRAARRLVETAEAGVEVAKVTAVSHARDRAMGVVGEAPVSVREARAALTAAQDRLETAGDMHASLTAELTAEKGRPDLTKMRVEKCAKSVVCDEMQRRASALAASVTEMQRRLVAAGSGLEWLYRAGVFREDAADVRLAVQRLEVAPQQWELGGQFRYATSFAAPSGRLTLEAAFEGLKRDASTAIPEVE